MTTTQSLRLASEDSIKEYMKLNLNIMLIGAHGVGKTQILQSVAKDLGYKMFVFNAALVDPYVDITGIPQVETLQQDNKEIKELSMIRKRDLDEADVIFFDEINRANPSTLNAIMNLVNEKKINNEVLPNLKCVVAASNPEEDDSTGNSYTVGYLDPAQADRFDVTMSISHKANKNHFYKVFGEDKKEFVDVLVDWQNNLEPSSGGVDRAPYISPRRLEKLGKLYIKIPTMNTLKDVLGFEASGLQLNSLNKKLNLALASNNIDRSLTSDSIIDYYNTLNSSEEWVVDFHKDLSDLDNTELTRMLKEVKNKVSQEESVEIYEGIASKAKEFLTEDKNVDRNSMTRLFITVSKLLK